MNFQYSVSTLFKEFSPLQPERERERREFSFLGQENIKKSIKKITPLYQKKIWAHLATLIGTVEFNVQ